MNSEHLSGPSVSTFSELLLFHVALGNGYIHPFPHPRGMVFTAAIHPGAHKVLRDAETLFHEWHSKRSADTSATPEEPEAAAVFPPQPGGRVKRVKRDTAVKRDDLSKLASPTWRDPYVNRSTMIEVLDRSLYRACSYVDEIGVKVSMMHNQFAVTSVVSLASLTGAGSVDVSLIRASATGGACIHTLAGQDKPLFNFVASITPARCESLGKAVRDRETYEPLQGLAILVPMPHGPAPALGMTAEGLFQVMTRVYACGNDPDNKIQVTFESSGLRAEWDAFMAQRPEDYFGSEEPSEAARKALARMPASAATLGGFATQAVVTRAVIEAVSSGAGTAVLRARHLEDAKVYAMMVFLLSSGTTHFDVRASNMAKAREARSIVDPSKLAEAMETVAHAIASAPSRLISRSKAITLPGVTPKLLDTMSAPGGCLVELKGKDAIGMGKTSRAYVLSSDVTGTDAEEAIHELEAAYRELDEHPDAVSTDELAAVMSELAQRVESGLVPIHGVPAVPVTLMTSRQIRAVPSLLRRPDHYHLRGTPDSPELEHLLDRGDGLGGMEPGVPNLWIRYDRSHRPFRDWGNPLKGLGMHNIWPNS